MKIDMHTHTYYSDGNFSPQKLIELAREKGLDGIAITDHDTVSGLIELMETAKLNQDFKLIPGIEFGCSYNNEEVHILGYFIDYKSEELVSILSELRKERRERAGKIIERLNNMGLKINPNSIKIGKDDFIGRFHIAKALLEQSYVKSIDDAFNNYLNVGKAAYIKRASLDIDSTIKLIQNLNGISVLAHPGLLKDKDIIDYCRDRGIMGLECYHSKHSKTNTTEFLEYAKTNKLIITGGSDCHGNLIDGELLLGKYFIEIEKGDILYEYL